MIFVKPCIIAVLLSVGISSARGQLLATDDFEAYAGNPLTEAGGSADWTGPWATNAEFAGGVYLAAAGEISGAKSVGLWGAGSETGTSVRRAFPPTSDALTISFSMRANFNATSVNAPTRRLAFTIRAGNGNSHFDHQRLSFFFAAGNNNLQWYDGADHESSAITFLNGAIYDLRAVLDPATRNYNFAISNRADGATFSYSGVWTTGRDLEPLNSIAFIMRAPAISGQDAFLDNVSIAAPDFQPPGPSIREGDWWRYYKGTSTPPAQGAFAWFHPAFDDSGWSPPAPSGFGYGDCDDHTELADMQNGYVSLFIRKPFVVEQPASIRQLSLGLDYDDGAAVFLNGAEVARLNLPGGSISHATQASSAREGSRGEKGSNPNPKSFIAIDPSLLVAGTNVLAISGHNASITSSDFTLIVELYTNAALVRGPFIQMPEAGPAAAIAWNTAAEADSVVEYGLDPGYSAGSISNGTPKREHVIHLSGLQPGTSYFYRVRSNGETLHAGTFRTRPAADQPYRLAIIGDHGQGSPGMRAVAQLINQRDDIDGIFTVGDNIYGAVYGTSCNSDGAPGWYDPYWFELFGPAMQRAVTFPALGNHDWDTADGQYMVDYFHLPTNGPPGYLEKNYSFEFGNMHVAVIDTEPYEDNNTAAIAAINAWLSADLAAATQLWRVVILHRPPFTSRGSHDDNLRVKQNIAPILKAHGAQVVLQGHNHWYERMNPIDGTAYFTIGGSGAWLYPYTTRKEYSARIYNERHSFMIMEIQDGRMSIEQFNDLGEIIDTHDIDLDHAFMIDGLIDDPAWERAANGLKLYAAIRENFLYVATQDAGEGSDHFVYVADELAAQQPANWSKSGSVMTWGAFLGDENDGAYQGWFNTAGAPAENFDYYKSMTSGTNNNAPYANGVLEGTIDLAGHFGAFPTNLYLAAAAFDTADGGALVRTAQTPAGNNDFDIQASEFLQVNPRDLALDLPVAVAGSNQSVEAGMWAVVSATDSWSPSGLPLTVEWTRIAGPDVITTNFNQLYAALISPSNVVTNTVVTLQVRAHDGRFYSEPAQVDVTFTPMTDSDLDGLSDQEEITGYDNSLTRPDPAGRVTHPANADSDGDGLNDGDEALAGTDPGDASSLLMMTEPEISGDWLSISWHSISGRYYRFERAAGVNDPQWSVVDSVQATSSLTRMTHPGAGTNAIFRLGVEAP